MATRSTKITARGKVQLLLLVLLLLLLLRPTSALVLVLTSLSCRLLSDLHAGEQPAAVRCDDDGGQMGRRKLHLAPRVCDAGGGLPSLAVEESFILFGRWSRGRLRGPAIQQRHDLKVVVPLRDLPHRLAAVGRGANVRATAQQPDQCEGSETLIEKKNAHSVLQRWAQGGALSSEPSYLSAHLRRPRTAAMIRAWHPGKTTGGDEGAGEGHTGGAEQGGQIRTPPPALFTSAPAATDERGAAGERASASR